jgi:serine/threonine protein kinase
LSPIFSTSSLDALPKHAALADQLIVIFQVAAALKTLHAQGIIHGGLKPSNVLLSGNLELAVTDYGLYKVVKPSDADLGTLQFFLAPELKGQPERATEQSDVYAFGMLMYRIMSGRVPSIKHLKDITDGQRPPLPPEWPREVRRLMGVAWAPKADRRPTFEAIVDRLCALKIEGPTFDQLKYQAVVVKIEGAAFYRGKLADIQRESSENRAKLATLGELVTANETKLASAQPSPASSPPEAGGWDVEAQVRAIERSLSEVTADYKRRLSKLERDLRDCEGKGGTGGGGGSLSSFQIDTKQNSCKCDTSIIGKRKSSGPRKIGQFEPAPEST